MSTTIRVSKKDKETLVNLAKRLGTKTMAETLRKAVSLAEENDDKFTGNTSALWETLMFAGSRGGRISERVDEELGKILYEETHRRWPSSSASRAKSRSKA